MLVMPSLPVMAGFSSVLSLTMVTSSWSRAISSRIGATARHGPHHSAQKSTSTGLSLLITSASNVSSVVLETAPIGGSFQQRGGGGVVVDGAGGVRHHRWSVGEEPLGVERRGTAGAGRRDRLAVGVVDQVAAGEDARDVGAGGAALDEHVALGVELDDALDELVARVVPDGDEQARDGQLAGLAGDGVAQGDPGELALTVDGVDGAVPREADLGVGVGALGHDLAGAQLVAAVHDRDRPGELGQEGGLLDRGVATADHGDVLVAEEEAVAGRTPRDTPAGQLVLARQLEL